MFPTRLKQLRKENNLSQSELAKRIGVSQQTIGAWEVGRTEPDLATLRNLADMFSVTTDYLLNVKQTPKWATKDDVLQLDQILDTNINMALGGENLTTAEKQRVRDILTATFWEKLPEIKGKNN